MTSLLPDQISIAVTVYNRRQFVRQAVASALNQTVPVRVIVVEDCGPDPALKSFVQDEFGSRIQYVRNPTRRGLFGNWNACMDLCRTPWLSILHDDDYLAPEFIEAMIELQHQAPDQALYFGRTIWLNGRDQPVGECPLHPVNAPWHRVGLLNALYGPPFDFPGQLFNVSAARDAGGFRESSFYTGDWEMWAKLIARGGAAQTAKIVAFNRRAELGARQSNAVIRSGRQKVATVMQIKRVLALLPPESRVPFDRASYHGSNPLPTSFFLRCGASLRPRFMAYNLRLLLLARPPHWRYALYQFCARFGRGPFIRLSSTLWHLLRRVRPES
jgi:glycosyltransferase involved in cell wall biosynthesis